MRARRWTVSCAVLAATALPSGGAAVATTRPPQSFATDGPVRALATSGTTLYVGGGFGRIGRPTGGGAVVDATTGLALGRGAAIPGTVTAATTDGRGGWFVAGRFTVPSGTGLAHVAADGTIDPRFRASIVGRRRVWALLRRGPVLYVGGSFARVDGARRTNLAAVSTRTGALLPFAPRVRGTVRALAATADRLYVGGAFARVGVTSVRGLASFRGSRVDSVFRPCIAGSVAALAVVRGTLVVGGSFSRVAGHPRANLARVVLPAGRLLPWAPKTDASVENVASTGSEVVVDGAFTSVNHRARGGLASIAIPSGAVLPFAPTGATPLAPLAVRGATLYAGGSAFSLRTGRPSAWSPVGRGVVHAIAVSRRGVYLGGELSIVGGQPRAGLAAIDTTTGAVTPWAPEATGAVLSIAVAGSTVYVGGPIAAAGERRFGAAAFDASTAAPTDWAPVLANPGPDGVLATAMVLDGGAVVIAGQFGYGTGAAAGSGLVRVDAATGAVVPGWTAAVAGPIFAIVNRLVRIGGTLFLTGSFATVDGASRRNLAAVDAATGALRPWAPDLGAASPRAVVASASAVFVAAGDGSLVALDPTTGGDTGWRTSVTTGEGGQTLAVLGDRLFVDLGREVSTSTGASAPWAGTSALVPGLGPGGRDELVALASTPADGRVYVGGNFGVVGADVG